MTAESPDSLHSLGDWNVAITNGLQHSLPEWLRPILDLASMAGGTVGWVLLIALSFWWSGSRLGVRVALVSSASAVINLLLKWTFLQPRPYFLSDRITALEASDGFGMPSGHAQGTAATWGAIARWSGARWLWAAAVAATLLAGVARVYYGVHSVLQVVCGWLLGAAVVLGAAALERPLGRWWGRVTPAGRWIVAMLPAAVLLAAGLALRHAIFAGWEAPLEWVARHIATSTRLDPSSATAELSLIDSSALFRWTGGLLGASLVAAWYATPGRAAVVVASLRRGVATTAIGMVAMTVVLGAGRVLIPRVGDVAQLAVFVVLLWTVGVVVPTVGARLDHALSGTK